jgi:purine nucleoside permease
MMRSLWEKKSWVIICFLLGIIIFLGLIFYFQPSAKDKLIRPKILTVTMFQLGNPLDSTSTGEATAWVQLRHLVNQTQIPGANSPLYCNSQGDHCLIVTGVGTANATTSLMALAMNENIDLSKTYILVAGIAGTSPNVNTIGGVVWADWVIDSTTVSEFDVREMPSDFSYPKIPYACPDQWCKEIFKLGTEIYQLNPKLVEWAYRLTEDLPLEDSPSAQASRALYPQDAAQKKPSVSKCTVLGGNTFWHGTLMSDWASWWVKQWTGGQSYYCMTAVEEVGILPAVYALKNTGDADPNRVMIVRVASNFDQQHPGQTAQESLAAALEGVNTITGLKNAYIVGGAVIDYIIQHWNEWEAGVPPLP